MLSAWPGSTIGVPRFGWSDRMASYFRIPSTDTSQAKGAIGAGEPPASLEALATVRRYERGQAIYGQDDSAEFWYRVVSGLLRRFSIRPSGRRQIVDFLQAGDFFGFAGGDELHGFCVEAVAVGTVVASYPRARVETPADSDPRVGQFIRQRALSAIHRPQGQIAFSAARPGAGETSAIISRYRSRPSAAR
jgi:CRP/FNR family transcriptional regulator